MWTSRETIRQPHKTKRNDTKKSTDRKPISVHLINYQIVGMGRDRIAIYLKTKTELKVFTISQTHRSEEITNYSDSLNRYNSKSFLLLL